MARCPSCHRHFAVLDDEDPASFDCPHCGYADPRYADLASTDPDDDPDLLSEVYMYVLKSDDLYWTGSEFSPNQGEAKRFPVKLEGIDSLFGLPVRWVHLRSRGSL